MVDAGREGMEGLDAREPLLDMLELAVLLRVLFVEKVYGPGVVGVAYG